ncbi:hypothetical protein ACGFN1_17515 [Streptomyces sp. NPDC048685]
MTWLDLGSLPDPVEPPQLLAVLGALVPDGPWCDARIFRTVQSRPPARPGAASRTATA